MDLESYTKKKADVSVTTITMVTHFGMTRVSKRTTVRNILTTTLPCTLCDLGELLPCNSQSALCSVHNMVRVLQHIDVGVQLIAYHETNLLLPANSLTQTVQVLVLIYVGEKIVSVPLLKISQWRTLARFFEGEKTHHPQSADATEASDCCPSYRPRPHYLRIAQSLTASVLSSFGLVQGGQL